VHPHRAICHAQLGQADAFDGKGRAVCLRTASTRLSAHEQQLLVELEPIEQTLDATFDGGGRGREMRVSAEHGRRFNPKCRALGNARSALVAL
jgi:hypothetical protein